jgi:glycogen phosphorylase
MRVNTFQVIPRIPDRLGRLREIALNLLWSWDEEVRSVFRRLDRDLWDQCSQDPIMVLARVSQERLDMLATDDAYLSLYDRVCERVDQYVKERTYWERRYSTRPLIAYFSAEYGLAECLPIYSGGLGLLAGHHLKAASDLGVPLVGVGLLYQQGYFRQYLANDGWQQESYPTNDFHNMALELVRDAAGQPLRVNVRLANETASVQVWKVTVGRLPLYLLDTNVPENPRHLQDITDQLYGGNEETRIRQELVLGVGGLRALTALDLRPDVCHMNEGHSAFLSVERIRMLMRDHGLSFAEALQGARAGNVFTTHTPVPAGFDAFPRDLMARYLSADVAEIGLSLDEFLALGRRPGDHSGPFNMAAFAIRTSAHVNGVSRLHGEVSRRLLREYIPSVPEAEVPVGYVTNGAHTRSVLSREMSQLYDRYLGMDWWRDPGREDSWARVDNIPDEELWATHARRRERLVAFARKRLVAQVSRRGATAREIELARGTLSTQALTIGFARRFATYKRAQLVLRDIERLGKILRDIDRPVQFIFAGKAHPRDNEGKEVLKQIVQFCMRDEFRGRAVFIEDYDITVARYLLQGVDVWLNTPRRLMEASGTSGMKVLPNGGLNLSILDGWWCEGFSADVGWAIGRGEDYQDYAYQDTVESNALYELLEKEIVPLFYDRSADGMPRAWIQRMKASMRRLSPEFSTNRMVGEYIDRYYRPTASLYGRLSADGFARAKALAAWKSRVEREWGAVRVEQVIGQDQHSHVVGESVPVSTIVSLGGLTPAEVAVEVYYGPVDANRDIASANVAGLYHAEDLGGGRHRYTGNVPCARSGLFGYTARVRPHHEDASNMFVTGLMTWS